MLHRLTTCNYSRRAINCDATLRITPSKERMRISGALRLAKKRYADDEHDQWRMRCMPVVEHLLSPTDRHCTESISCY